MGLKSQELRTQDLTSIPPSSRGNSSTLTPAPSEDSPGPGLSLPRRPSNAGQGRTEGQTDTDRQGFATVGAPAQAAARARVQTAPVPRHPSPAPPPRCGPSSSPLEPQKQPSHWATRALAAPRDRRVASHRQTGGSHRQTGGFPPASATGGAGRQGMHLPNLSTPNSSHRQLPAGFVARGPGLSGAPWGSKRQSTWDARGDSCSAGSHQPLFGGNGHFF